MPFPWKKNRVTRISQIVADLQSPKRGGSLVVETGFPTSLIDLFVKNRSRFKKHRSKKPLQPDIPDPPPPPPSPATSPPPHPESEVPQTEENGDAVAISDRVVECSSGLVVVKILLAVVLVASVTRLTIGITVSALALLFLEYAGKRVVSCSIVESLSRRVSACVWFRKVKKEPVQGGGAELSSESLSIDEIEVVEAKNEVGICCELGSLSGDMAWGSGAQLLEPCPCEVSECKIRGSRSGRFKSKMVKKLVPKKFRGSKKEKKEKGSKHNEVESGSEVSSAVEEDKLPILEIEEDVGKEEEENGDKSIKTKLECIRDNEVGCGITCSRESQMAREVGVSNEKRVDIVGNSGSVILVIIALAGLLLGRFPALILSITWCFLLIIVKSLPLIKCSALNS